MQREFIEVVFEGHYNAIKGFIDGFVAGTGKGYRFYFSSDAGVEAETLSEQIREWITLGGKIHHVLMEKELFDSLCTALAAGRDNAMVNNTSIKSSKPVKGASFRFHFAAFGKKYAEEIKSLIGSLPEGVSLSEYNPEEQIDRDAQGTELYAPAHDYSFEGKGLISGPVDPVIATRFKLDAHPLIEAQKVLLVL